MFKVFEGRPDRGKVDRSSTGQSGVQEVVNEPSSGLGHVVRRREECLRLVESIGAERCIQNAKYKLFIIWELPRTV